MNQDLWARRPLFNEDHEAFRVSVRKYVARSVHGRTEAWDKAGIIPRETWLEAGRQGYLGINAPGEHGGGDALSDYAFRVAMVEELARAGATSLAAGVSCRPTSSTSPPPSRPHAGCRACAPVRRSARSR